MPPVKVLRESIEQQNARALRLLERGDCDFAAATAREAIRQSHELYGAHHAETGRSVLVLAMVMRQCRDLRFAEKLYLHAAEVFRQHKDDQAMRDLAACLNELGTLYDEQGMHDRALELLTVAVEVATHTYGEGHPNTAIGLTNLGACHHQLRNFDQAKLFYAQAAAILRQAHGDEHPTVTLIHTALLELHAQERSARN